MHKYIEKFLDGKRVTPLVFKDLELPEGVSSDTPIKDLILWCLETSYWHKSVDTETGVVETRNGAARTSLDIWRHIKYINPDITLESVIKALWEMGTIDGTLKGHRCADIGRQVFKTSIQRPSWNMSGLSSTEYEYSFNQWNLLFEEEL